MWPGGPLKTEQAERRLQVGRMVSGNYQSLGVGWGGLLLNISCWVQPWVGGGEGVIP